MFVGGTVDSFNHHRGNGNQNFNVSDITSGATVRSFEGDGDQSFVCARVQSGGNICVTIYFLHFNDLLFIISLNV